MAKKLAREIKELRKTCTWRMVTTRFGEKHPEFKVINGNQLEGIEICKCCSGIFKGKMVIC